MESTIKDPKLQESIDRIDKKIEIEKKELLELKKQYRLEWSEEALSYLRDYLATHKEVPDDPELRCYECGESKTVNLFDFIMNYIKYHGLYNCPQCRKDVGLSKWIIKCREHGFSKSQALTRLAHWDTSRDTHEQSRLKKIMIKYIDDFPNVKSLYIVGKTGTGKTLFAEIIGLELLLRGKDVLYAEYHRFAKEGKAIKNNEQKYTNPEILLIDDFTEESVGYEYSTWIFPIISNRHKMHKPTIITNNVPLEDLLESKRSDSVRLASRFNSKRYERILFRIEEDLRIYYE